MQTFASLRDFSHSAMFLPLFLICNIAFINTCLHTNPPSVFGRPLSRLPLQLLLNSYFILPSILLTQPIQLN
jgi:hypothetical protein